MREGLIPHAVTTVLRVDTDERSAKAMTELFGEVFDPNETAVATFERDDGSWLLEAYFSTPPDEEAVRGLIGQIAPGAAPGASFDTVSQKDWVAASLEGLKPVRAGRFLVHGGHDRDKVRGNDLAIEIEAALAFGTGHHGTTRGCLLAIDALLKRRKVMRALDVGTGTGVLAFALAKATKRLVVAGDIDPIAVEVARANARANGIAPWLALYAAPGIRHALADRTGRFDLVVANILARPLMRLAPDIARVTAPGGTVILSGLLDRDVPGIVSTFGAQGLRLERRALIEDWATLTLRKG
jgi:ribosomal protein L11 methyltransferase